MIDIQLCLIFKSILVKLQTVFKAMPKSDEIAQSAAITAVNRLGNEYLGKITDKIDSGLSKSYTSCNLRLPT